MIKANENVQSCHFKAIPGITLALGIWQTKRRRWKLDLLKELEEKTTLEPVSLPTK